MSPSLPVSQSSPVYPVTQLHTRVSLVSRHVPPFRHGVAVQRNPTVGIQHIVFKSQLINKLAIQWHAYYDIKAQLDCN